MSETFPGRIDNIKIGLSDVTNEPITNIVLMNWERNHDVRPRLFANLKYPTTYQQPHSWIVGSFSVLSDQHVAIYGEDVHAGGLKAMVENGDSNVIDYFVVTYKDISNNVHTTTFSHGLIYRYTKELLNYDDSVWVYHFLAGYAVDA